MRTYSSRAPASCHGTMFEWCSISVSTTRSPSATFVRATRLIAPVAFGVKIVPRASQPEPLRDPLARALEPSVASAAIG